MAWFAATDQLAGKRVLTPLQSARLIAAHTAAKDQRIMPRILVIDNYDSFTFNLVHYLKELGAEVTVRRNDALDAADAVNGAYTGCLISPGPCSPNEAGVSLPIVAACAEARLPLLGVCLGHQAIGQHFGGRVVRGGLMHGKNQLGRA